MEEKSYNQYITEVAGRFNELSEEERDVLRSLRGTQEGLVMAKVLGPDMASVDLGRTSKPVAAKPKRRGLGLR